MSFQLETDEKSFAGSSLILQTVREIQLAFTEQKKARRLTQQSVADKLGLRHRSIVSRWLRGNENLSLRTIGELAWALNKRPVIKFEEQTDIGGNFFEKAPILKTEAATAQVIHRDASPEAWEHPPNTVQQSVAVLENA